MADISLHFSAKAPLAGSFSAFNRILSTWRQRSRERRELQYLDHRTMRDLGISPNTIQFEASKPFWRD